MFNALHSKPLHRTALRVVPVLVSLPLLDKAAAFCDCAANPWAP